MIDINLLREQPEEIKRGIAAKGANPKLVDDFLTADSEWKKILLEVESARARQKKLGEERKIDEAKALKDEIKIIEENLKELEGSRLKILRQIPNPPLASVPVGKDETESIVMREVGEHPSSVGAKYYLEIAEALGLLDTERAGKVSGSRFGYILGGLVRFEFALVQLVMDALSDEKVLKKIIKANKLAVSPAPFVPIIPPVLVKREMMEGMGYVERGADEMYYLPKDDTYLVVPPEQSIGPMHAGEVLDETTLPRRYLGFSTCFRREAGSYGKDTKGIRRVDQFDKLEMFSITTLELSDGEHKLLLAIEEYLMQTLQLPYRVVNHCTGELGDPAAAKYDIEAWLPGHNNGQGEYRETHSTSNTTDFQSRRLNVKFKNKETGRNGFVHMLNGTAVAMPRMLIAIIENYQQKDGSLEVPKALRKYTGLKMINPHTYA